MAQRIRNRSLDMYKLAGAEARLIKTLFSRFAVDCGNIVPAFYCAKLNTARRHLDEFISNAEDCMYRDFKDLGSPYINVFYGAIDNECTTNEIDKEVRSIAIGLLEDLKDKCMEEQAVKV